MSGDGRTEKGRFGERSSAQIGHNGVRCPWTHLEGSVDMDT